MAVEVKRKATLEAIDQLTRYMEWLNLDSSLNPPIRGILAAQTFAPQVKALALRRGISCVLLDYDALRGLVPDELRLF